MELAGNVALVTGAARGLGRAIDLMATARAVTGITLTVAGGGEVH